MYQAGTFAFLYHTDPIKTMNYEVFHCRLRWCTAWATAQARGHGLLPVAMQPHIALVCRLMIFDK